jgi:hypothetical protein
MLTKAVKYLYKFCKSFDISPIDSGGLSKSLLYIVWGLNLVAFAGSDLVRDEQFYFSSNQHGSIIYTVEKKVSAKDLYTENIELISSTYFIVISSYDYEVPQFDVLIVHRGRSPPSLI